MSPSSEPALLETQDRVVSIFEHKLEGGRGQLPVVCQHVLTELGLPHVGGVNHIPHFTKGAPWSSGREGRGGEGREGKGRGGEGRGGKGRTGEGGKAKLPYGTSVHA